jgi:hypothetical protein
MSEETREEMLIRMAQEAQERSRNLDKDVDKAYSVLSYALQSSSKHNMAYTHALNLICSQLNVDVESANRIFNEMLSVIARPESLQQYQEFYSERKDEAVDLHDTGSDSDDDHASEGHEE